MIFQFIRRQDYSRHEMHVNAAHNDTMQQTPFVHNLELPLIR